MNPADTNAEDDDRPPFEGPEFLADPDDQHAISWLPKHLATLSTRLHEKSFGKLFSPPKKAGSGQRAL